MERIYVTIEEYVEHILVGHLESGSLFLGNAKIVFIIQDTLLKKARGMNHFHREVLYSKINLIH